MSERRRKMLMVGLSVYFFAPIIIFEGFIMMHDHKYGGGGRREVSRQLEEMGNDFKRMFGFSADETVQKALADEKQATEKK